MRVTVDTNILIYAFAERDGGRQEAAQYWLVRTRAADSVLTLQSLGEFYHSAVRKTFLASNRAARVIERLPRLFPTTCSDERCPEAAIQANLIHGLQFWDALLWATASKAGCSLILTEDFQDDRQLGGVTFVNPFNSGNRVLLDAALPAVE